MPYKSIVKRRAAVRRSHKKRRAAAVVSARLTAPDWPSDPAAAVVEWARDSLRIPHGHPRAGQPFELPDYLADVIRDIYAPGVREVLLLIARKNAKSAAIAAVLLAHLAGPVRRFGFRAGVASISKEKAGELKTQCEAIAESSGLDGLRFLRSPAPGRIVSPWGTVDVLSADSNSGSASGFDLAIVDEIGLLTERDRDLVNGLRSSVSARNGRFLSLSVRGTSPFVPEILERRGDPSVRVHEYAAKADAAIDDESAWRSANPGLACGIKSLSYMQDEARRVAVTRSDEPSFRALDLNQKIDPTKEMIFSVSDVAACCVDELPERSGPVCIGVDFGEATSASAWCAIWPETGRMETRLAFGDKPSLADRGKADGANYVAMFRRGELISYEGRVTPIRGFLADLVVNMAGQHVHGLAADSYKDSESKDFFEGAGVRWPVEFRRVGAGKDGGRDVRALQRLVLTGRLKMIESLAFGSAVAAATLRRDQNGNPGLSKASSRGRIDVLSASVIAAGLAEPLFDRPRRRPRRFAFRPTPVAVS